MTATAIGSRGGTTATANFLRQSTMLVISKTVAQAAEFGLQLFAVRYFSKPEFGAFGYALSIVFLCRAIAVFEMPLALARFIPTYLERRRVDAAVGSVIVGVAVVLAVGMLLTILLVTGIEVFHLRPTVDSQALALLVVLALVVPLDALDILLTALFATFGHAGVIFARQVLLGPVARVALVVTVVFTDASITAFAIGYVITSAATLLVYGGIFVRCLLRNSELRNRQADRFSYPTRSTLAFAAPMLLSTLVWLLLDSTDGILLGHFKGITEVAAFRAVLPLALLNQGVILAATALYSPALARLLERGEHEEVSKLYWRSTLWIAVATFPIFVATFSFAPTIAVSVIGRRYESSAPILAVLAAGYFFHSSLGFNGLTLRVLGRVRYSVCVDAAAAAANLAINLVLIPRWGALGAAIGTSATLVLHNLLKQYGLRRYLKLRFLERTYIPIYAAAALLATALLALQSKLPQSPLLALLFSACAGAFLVWNSRKLLEIESVFPETSRLRAFWMTGSGS
jgi:O-antigen/teichoic acid export membrane protein